MTLARPTYEELLARVAELERLRPERVSAPVTANDALRETEEQYRQVVERASDGIVVHTGQKVVFANPAFAAMSGYSPAELVGIECFKLVPPEQHALVADRTRRRLAGEEAPSDYALDLLRKDGTVFSVEVRASAINYHNEPHHLVVLRDVTERKRAEQALRESEEKYRLVFESAGDAICIHDAEGRMLASNRTACEQFGYTYSELMSLTVEQLDTPEQAQHVPGRIAHLLEHGSVSFETVHRRKDGSLVPADVRARRITWGGKAAVMSIARDITERKRAEEATRRAEESARRATSLLRRTFDAIPDLLTVHDRDLRVVLSNWHDHAHVTEEERNSQPYCYSCYMRREQPCEACPTMEVFRTGVPVTTEVTNLFTGRLLEVNAYPVPDDSGAVGLVTEHVRDITERKRAEAQLAQADRLASMGMMAAGVGHEVNNPLTYLLYNIQSLAQDMPMLAGAVSRCCSALRDEIGPEGFAKVAGEGSALLQPAVLADMADRVRDSLDGALRIKNVTRSLSAFARNEHLELSGVDLINPIESAVKMASNEIRHRARLVKDFGEVPDVWASEGKLAQVFLNLLVNAAHSIDEGHAEENLIKIKTWAEGNAVYTEIKDTGAGIAPESLGRIFEPFFTTKGAGKGSGLGLSICRNILTGFGGDLRVESEVGKGSRFVVRLPAKPRALPSAPAPTVTVGLGASGGRILVVDDEEAIRDVLLQLLGQKHEVVTAGSGKEGRAILEGDQAFDVILCDLMMPEVTGMDLHSWLVKEHPLLAQRTVFITGGAFTPKAETYLASVSNARVEKPFHAGALMMLMAEKIVTARNGS